VAETASAAGEMTSRTIEVSAEAEQTGRRAADVRENAAALVGAVGELRRSVIRAVRTATHEVDRRTVGRNAVDLAGRLMANGQTCSVRIADLSDGGAGLSGAPVLPVGTRGTLHIDGVGVPLGCMVISSEAGLLNTVFDLDAATAASFATVLDRLVPRQAA
jgi:methyl-accepting chemotaxis protein